MTTSREAIFTDTSFPATVAASSFVAAQHVPCAHCGLPSPPPRDDSHAFCCQGCQGAYALIHGWGLEDYYALRDQLAPAASRPVSSGSRVADLLEDLAASGVAVQQVGNGLAAVNLAIDGLHCGACSWLIERCPSLVDGWQAARVQMSDHTIQLVYNPERTSPAKIANVLQTLGYQLAPNVTGESESLRHRIQDRRHLTGIAIAFFCAANGMWIAVALYAGEFSGIASNHANILRWAGTLLGLFATAVPGSVFFRGAWAALKTKTPHMDLPVSLGLGAGVIGSLVGAWRGTGDIYFDSLAVLVFLLLLGRWIQFRQQRRAGQAVSLLMRLTPQIARRIGEDGVVQSIPADRLVIGDLVEVRVGETIVADGAITTGNSLLDRALLTGESEPVAVNVGDQVAAGTINLLRPLQVRVAAVGRDSRIGQLMQMVEDGASRQTPIVQLADRIGGWFVMIVIALAVITVVAWWQQGVSQAIGHAVALLIVACPCALALATPLSIAVALGRSAKQRILIRSGDVFERMSKPGMIWFDKTGTLTTGRMEVKVWDGAMELLGKAAAVEQSSTHPVASAICRAAKEQGSPVFEATHVEQLRGGGIQGQVDGQWIRVGTEDFMRQHGVELPHALRVQLDRVVRLHMTPVLVAEANLVRGVFGIADSLRPDAKITVDALRDHGWQVGILSGDHPEVAQFIGRQLNIPASQVLGGQSPEQKVNTIEKSREAGTVVMVGDGINDAAALAAAHVGIATRGGAEVSLQAAPVFLSSDGLSGVALLTKGAQRTMVTIRRGFALSLGYNIIAVVLAMQGLINPLLAAVLMPISSLSVVSLAFASRTYPASQEGAPQ